MYVTDLLVISTSCTCQNFNLFPCTLMNVSIVLQCCDHLAFNDYTLHLLCHYAGFEGLNKFNKVWTEVLPDFLKVRENYNWFKEAMCELLKKKGMSHEEYLVKLLKGAIPFDEGGILLFARTTGLHFGIIMNEEYWCTNCDNDPEKWAGMFMYAGNLKFVDTTAGQMEMEDCYELLNLNAFRLPHGSTPPPSPTASQTPSEKSSEQSSQVSLEKTDSDEEYLPPSKRPRNRNSERRRALLAKVRKPVKKTTKSSVERRQQVEAKNC